MIITLCGSTKFKRKYMEWNRLLTLAGHVVITVSMWTHDPDEHVKPTENEKRVLDLVHLNKIRISEAVVIISEDHYIGDSTRNEIKWTSMLGKPVYYIEPVRDQLDAHTLIQQGGALV